MPPALCVAADVGRSPTRQQSPLNTQLSGSGTRRTFRTRQRARTAQSGHSPTQASSPNLSTWLPHQRGPPQYGVAPSPLQPQATIRLQQSTFSLKDQAVEKFEAGLQKQGSLSSTGKMTPPVHIQNIPARVQALASQSGIEQRGQSSSAHDRFTPTTPAFYPSPTSPATPTIPPTPPMSQESWHQPSASKYPYTAYAGDRNIYSPQPFLRKRSVTTSSIPPPLSPVKLSPVALPIGKKVPKWREAYEDVTPSQVYATTSYTSSTKIRYSRSTDSSPPRYQRLTPPMGPRPRGSRAYSNGLGIDMSRSNDMSCEDHTPSSYLSRARRRQYTVDSQTEPDWPGTERSFPGLDAGDEYYSRVDEMSLADGSRRGASDESDCVTGSVWEGQGYESGCEEDGGEEVECRSSSEGSHGERSPRAPFILPPPWPEQRPQSADRNAPPLEEPFELREPSSVESGERSAFDSDTEDEDEAAPLGRRFTKLRKQLKTSMSVPSIKARLSVFSTTGPSSLEISPESVSSLRARQTTNSSTPGRNPYLLKLATDMALDPIPPSPADMESPELPERADEDPVHSPETPVTPSSPQVRQTKSFIWEVSKAPLFLSTPPPPLPGSSPHRGGGPPNLPLPATPMSMSTPSLPLRPTLSHTGRSGSFVEKWRMNVGTDRVTMVDPNMSMARLEESIAKLESHAPRTSSETDQTGSSGRQHSFEEIRPSMDSASVYSNAQTREGDEPGVVVLSVEPTPVPEREVNPPRSASRRISQRLPPTPPKPVPVATSKRIEHPARRPSLALLPLFDFETNGELDLELQVPPIRSSSLISPRSSAESPQHPRSVSADQESSISQAQSMPIVLEPVRLRPVLESTPPRIVSEPPVSSFMNFSPPQKPQSRMRRLLKRVDLRGGVAKGLRGSLAP